MAAPIPGELLTEAKVGQRSRDRGAVSSQRPPQRIDVGSAGVHFYRPVPETGLEAIKLSRYEFSPRTSISAALISQIKRRRGR